MRACERCSVRSFCAFKDPCDIKGLYPDRPSYCRHFVCPEGRKAGRNALKAGKPRKKVRVEDGMIYEGVSFGAGDKSRRKSGWVVLEDGMIITKDTHGNSRVSGQNVLKTQLWGE